MTIKELSLYLWAVLLVEVKKRGHPLSLMNLIYLGEKKANPDLAIEVILASGSLEKLEKYRRFEIPEVWLWENNQQQVYAFISSEYHLVPRSQLLPDLDIALLVSCVQMPSRLEAMRAFRHGLHYE
jgi:hypothetical protein